MFRTRDFVLFFTTIVFLVAAIGFTVVRQQATLSQTNVIVPHTTDEISTVSSDVALQPTAELSREERLRQLRDKIKTSELLTITEPAPQELDEEDVVIVLETETAPLSAPLLCGGYRGIIPANWSTAVIKSESVEGARQYFIPIETEVSASSSVGALSRKVLLSLSQSQVPYGAPQCIPFDVIGVATDGSLIRNSEVGLYRVFGEETLIGYALDGFPIYGLSSSPTDQCGGKIIGGQYRYILSSARDVMINCFAGTPANFAS